MTKLRFALRVIASLSVAELFALLGSVTVAGGVTVALLTAFCDQTNGLAMSAALKTIAAAIERRDLSAMQVKLASTETSPWTRPPDATAARIPVTQPQIPLDAADGVLIRCVTSVNASWMQ